MSTEEIHVAEQAVDAKSGRNAAGLTTESAGGSQHIAEQIQR